MTLAVSVTYSGKGWGNGGTATSTSTSTGKPSLVRRAEGIALLEERRWCGCVLGLHQRDQDPGSEWRRSLAGQRALRCVQRCSGPHPFLLTEPLLALRSANQLAMIRYNQEASRSSSAMNCWWAYSAVELTRTNSSR